MNHNHKTGSGNAACPACRAEQRSLVTELQGRITDLIGKDPNKAAKILTSWLREEESKKKKKSAA